MAETGEHSIPNHDYRYKIVLIGDPGVGKTSLLLRYTEDLFPETEMANVGVDFKTKLIDVDGKKVYLEIWDTAGQERFRTISASFYKGAHGIILVYDITDEETYVNLRSWLSEMDRHLYENSEVVKMLVGNKIDSDKSRRVRKATAADLAQSVEMDYQETSAKDAIYVNEMFESLVRSIISTGEAGKETKPGVIQINSTTNRKRSSQGQSSKCCGKA